MSLPITGDVVIRKVPKETLELLAEAAAQKGVPREAYLRGILDEWVEENSEPA